MIIDTSLVETSPDKKIQEIASEKQFLLENIGKAMIVSADYFGNNVKNITPRLGFDILVPKFRYDAIVVHGFCQKQITSNVTYQKLFLILNKNLNVHTLRTKMVGMGL